MLDTIAVQRLIEEQIVTTVNQQVLEAITSEEWLQALEQKIIKYTQDRILGKFSNSNAVPELVDAIKISVKDLFAQGQVPGIEKYVDESNIKQCIDLAVEQLVQSSIDLLGQDPVWLSKIENTINQSVVQRTIASLNSIDVNSVIQQRVDEKLNDVHAHFLQNFKTSGIIDKSTEVQLTVMDGVVVAENDLTTRTLQVVESAVVQDLVVKGSINTDNRSWNDLADVISNKTLEQLNDDWKESLVAQVRESITENGINFNTVNIDGEPLVSENKLSSKITDSKLQTVGQLHTLVVKGEASIFDTVVVKNHRLGINTHAPEMALSVWDEEVSVVIGKNKSKQAYIGTNRDQSLVLGTNRQAQVEIDVDGLTRIKKLQVGLHQIGHSNEVPGWSGTRGDLIFNTSPGPDRVFGWVCLGAYKWQTLKSA